MVAPVDRGASRTAPRDRSGLEQLGEQIQLVVEELVVLGQVVAEERIGLGKGSAAENDLGTPVRQTVDGREALEDAHRIIGAEHGDGGAEENPGRPGGDRAEDDLGRRDRKVAAMMLADAEGVEPDLVGEHGFGNDVAQVRAPLSGECRRPPW